MSTNASELRQQIIENERKLRERMGVVFRPPEKTGSLNPSIDTLRDEIEANTGQILDDTRNAAGKGLSTLEAQAMRVFQKTDPNVDQGGLDDFGFRAKFAGMDTPEERANYLADTLGEDGFSFDGLGNYTITPAGQARLGMEPGERDLALDEPGFSINDVADFAGATGPVAGAVGGATAGTAMGGPAGGIVGAAMGAGLGSAGQELSEHLAGRNLEPGSDVAKRVVGEALTAAAGEGIFNFVVKPVARFIAGPQAGRMTREKEDLMTQALEMGVLPEASQVTNAPIAGYFRQVFNNIFGDPNQAKNATALHNRMKTMRDSVDTFRRDLSDIGQMVKDDITGARQKMARESSAMYGRVDSMVNGEPFIPTAPLKRVADEIGEDFVRNQDGKLVLVSDVFADQIQRIRDMPDYITARQMQNMRSMLRAARQDNTLLPDISSYHSRMLSRAVNEAVDTVASGPSTLTPEAKAAANKVVAQTARIKDPTRKEEMIKQRFEEMPLHLQAAAAGEVNRMTGLQIAPSQRAISGARAARALKQAGEEYKAQIEKFDNALVQRLARDPSFAGSVDPEMVVSSVFRKGRASNIRRLRNVLKPDTWKAMQASAMDEIIGKATRSTDDPFVALFDGKQFVDTLDSFGKETLEEMFGKSMTKSLYDFGNVTKLVTKGAGGGAGKLVAAGIVIKPLQNFGRLVRLFTMRSMLNNPAALRWLTTGIQNPTTKEGAKALFRFGTQALMTAEQYTRELEAGRDQQQQFRERATELMRTASSPNPQGGP